MPVVNHELLGLSDLYLPWPPIAENPLAAVAIEATRGSATRAGLVDARFDLRRFYAFASSATYFYPSAGLEELIACSDWCAWLFFLDDSYDESIRASRNLAAARELHPGDPPPLPASGGRAGALAPPARGVDARLPLQGRAAGQRALGVGGRADVSRLPRAARARLRRAHLHRPHRAGRQREPARRRPRGRAAADHASAVRPRRGLRQRPHVLREGGPAPRQPEQPGARADDAAVAAVGACRPPDRGPDQPLHQAVRGARAGAAALRPAAGRHGRTLSGRHAAAPPRPLRLVAGDHPVPLGPVALPRAPARRRRPGHCRLMGGA